MSPQVESDMFWQAVALVIFFAWAIWMVLMWVGVGLGRLLQLDRVIWRNVPGYLAYKVREYLAWRRGDDLRG